MLSTRLSTQSFVSSLIFSFALLTFPAIIPDTFAQTPNVAPVAVLISLPGDPAASRPRRVAVAKSENESGRSDATEIEKRAFEAANAVRQENGLLPLDWNSDLCQMARTHSEKMARLGFFSHETPDGLRLKDRARAAGVAHFQLLGENIAYNQGFDDPGAFAVEKWMLSPGHRRNILNPRFQMSAIGVFVAPDGTVYLTQDFMAR
jgi:uncharacterized protein YkwD